MLGLILKYWNNPTLITLENTLKQIREYYPITGYSAMGDWKFSLTPESLVNLSKKYLNQDLPEKIEKYTFLVDSTNLSLKILSSEEWISYFTEFMKRTPIPTATA